MSADSELMNQTSGLMDDYSCSGPEEQQKQQAPVNQCQYADMESAESSKWSLISNDHELRIGDNKVKYNMR